MKIIMSNLVLSIFEDEKKHTLQDVYKIIEETYAQENQVINHIDVRHRIRSRINDLCSKGLIIRTSPSTYQRLKSTSD